MEDSQPCLSLNLDHTKNSTTAIPPDLTYEILSKLPARSIIRFQAVSKLWFSIIRSKDFVNSFLALSKTRPRLLFIFKDFFGTGNRFIFSAPEHEHDKDDDTKVVTRHDMTMSDLAYYIKSRPVNGFVCCTWGDSVAVCNPTTRQIVKLPDVKSNGRHVHVRLGYDPVQDEYKVLCVMMFDGIRPHSPRYRKDIEQEHFVFTLRSQQKEWKKIIDVPGDPYTDVSGGICIDGAIYFGDGYTRIARFDVRTEKVEFIQTQLKDFYRCTFINHQGKLGAIQYVNDNKIHLWMQEREEYWNCWGSDLYLWDNMGVVTCPGEIHTGEVMFCRRLVSKPFFVSYYDPIKDSIRSGEVEGIADNEFRSIHGIGNRLYLDCFPGLIENIMFL